MQARQKRRCLAWQSKGWQRQNIALGFTKVSFCGQFFRIFLFLFCFSSRGHSQIDTNPIGNPSHEVPGAITHRPIHPLCLGIRAPIPGLLPSAKTSYPASREFLLEYVVRNYISGKGNFLTPRDWELVVR